MIDQTTAMEDAVERKYFEMLQPDGFLKCCCGNLFDPEVEGGCVSPNPYAMPVCGECLEEDMRDNQ